MRFIVENTLSASALDPGRTEIRARISDIRGYAAHIESFVPGSCIACIAASTVGLDNLFTKERYVENSIHSYVHLNPSSLLILTLKAR